jgi:hypothetical protein
VGQRDRETEWDRETERKRDRKTERQRDRETERQRDRETEKQSGTEWQQETFDTERPKTIQERLRVESKNKSGAKTKKLVISDRKI